jgi:hypothetical protein
MLGPWGEHQRAQERQAGLEEKNQELRHPPQFDGRGLMRQPLSCAHWTMGGSIS